jgi:outer membrane protein TolC
MRVIVHAFLAGTLAALAAATAAADELPRTERPPANLTQPHRVHRVYDLERCLELARRNYPKVAAARAGLRKKRADRALARRAPFSELKASGGVATVPSLTGTNIYSPDTDVSFSSNMSLAWQAGIEWVFPLWTFGKIDSVWDAADANVTVGKHEVRKAKNEVMVEVRRAYYGAQLARDAMVLLRDAEKRIDKYLGRLEQAVAAGEGDDIELLKLKMHRAELDARHSEAAKQATVALSGLRFLTGVHGDFDIPDEPLERTKHRLGPLPRYLAAARLHRPEINMARAGVLARQAQVRLERARAYPDVGLGFRWKYASAPEIADQRNPFVKDAANYHSYGAGLVFEWKLQPIAARLAGANAELEKMRATERYALGGVGVEVEKAYAEAEDAALRLEAYERAAKYARQWLIKVQQGIDIGTFDDEDIIDPAKEYALKRFSVMSATFDYNVAMAQLALATGWDELADR